MWASELWLWQVTHFIFLLGKCLFYFLLNKKVKIFSDLEKVVNFEENLPINTMIFLKIYPFKEHLNKIFLSKLLSSERLLCSCDKIVAIKMSYQEMPSWTEQNRLKWLLVRLWVHIGCTFSTSKPGSNAIANLGHLLCLEFSFHVCTEIKVTCALPL